MQLPKLYSRTSTGAVQEWSVEIVNNQYRVTSGQVDGQKTVADWTTCKGKNIGRANETSPEEQAISEAQSKWEKKCKTGYTDDINTIDTCLTFIKPMLAEELEEYMDKIDFSKGVLVQNKYNGVRAVATLENGKVMLKSRKGEIWVSVPHINKDLEPFFASHPDAVLDGELYNYDLRQKLNELSKLVRRTKNITPEHFIKSEQMVRFYVYDGYGLAPELGQKTPYKLRKQWIDRHLPKYSRHFRHVASVTCYSMAEVDNVYHSFLADGEEGAIIRMPDSFYENKRSKNTLKYKPEDDSEGKIIAIHEGTGNWAGTAKTATLEWRGKTFEATFKGTYEQGVERLKNKADWIGKEVTFLYTGLTGLGVPNYARIDPDNCFK